jgi:aspartate-semialdehyde dehydrogenase
MTKKIKIVIADDHLLIAETWATLINMDPDFEVVKVFDNTQTLVEEISEIKPDIAIFSAGGDTSLLWAPKFAEVGTIVIDNSSAWRMNPDHKLIVPEINADSLTPNDRIIANPNCSTIQMVVALAPLHKKLKINRIVVSTYQSITGTGMKAVKQYQLEKKGFVPKPEEMAYHYPIFENCIPNAMYFWKMDTRKKR